MPELFAKWEAAMKDFRSVGIGQDMLGTIFFGGRVVSPTRMMINPTKENAIKRDENQLHWDYKAQHIGMLKSEDGQTLI